MRLHDNFIGISLNGWDSRTGGVVAAGHDNTATAGWVGASSAIEVAVEFVESDLPGGDTIDIAVASDDRKVLLYSI